MRGGGGEELAHNLLAGIITQLRSVPTGILVDIYLYREFENLRKLQETSLTQQVHEYWASLQIDKKQFPEFIVAANQHMNAAHAAMVNYQYPSPELFSPYKLAGMESIALKLLDPCLTKSIETIKDKELIDHWAENLNLKTLYRWV